MNANNIVAKVEMWRKMRGITANDMATKMHMSIATYYRRLKSPEELTMAEIGRMEKVTRMTLLQEVD